MRLDRPIDRFYPSCTVAFLPQVLELQSEKAVASSRAATTAASPSELDALRQQLAHLDHALKSEQRRAAEYYAQLTEVMLSSQAGGGGGADIRVAGGGAAPLRTTAAARFGGGAGRSREAGSTRGRDSAGLALGSGGRAHDAERMDGDTGLGLRVGGGEGGGRRFRPREWLGGRGRAGSG